MDDANKLFKKLLLIKCCSWRPDDSGLIHVLGGDCVQIFKTYFDLIFALSSTLRSKTNQIPRMCIWEKSISNLYLTPIAFLMSIKSLLPPVGHFPQGSYTSMKSLTLILYISWSGKIQKMEAHAWRKYLYYHCSTF